MGAWEATGGQEEKGEELINWGVYRYGNKGYDWILLGFGLVGAFSWGWE
jgi:hypothetical protein